MENAPQYDADTFEGFIPPTANFSKLPHQLIEALPLIETLGEMKVILYVLRHTWGYQDEEKRISLDEFCNGRKHSARYLKRHPDSPARIDSGTGLSINTVKQGIERAVKHGFLTVDEDDSDRARIKRWYSLSESDCQKLIPGVSEVDPLPSETDPRTKKETLERNSSVSAVAEKPDDPPEETTKRKWTHGDIQYIEMVDSEDREHHCQECDKPFDVYTLLDSGALCYWCARPMQVKDWNKRIIKKAPLGVRHAPKKKHVDAWMDKPVRGWCILAGKPYNEMAYPTKRKLAAIFKGVGKEAKATPERVFGGLQEWRANHPKWTYYNWPGETFCNILVMDLLPDAAPGPNIIKLAPEHRKVIRVS